MSGLIIGLLWLAIWLLKRPPSSPADSPEHRMRGESPSSSPRHQPREYPSNAERLTSADRRSNTQPEVHRANPRWKVKGDRLVGAYRNSHRPVPGYVKNWRSTEPEFYIIHPPQALREKPQLEHRGNGRYRINFLVSPHGIPSGIGLVERMLTGVVQRPTPRPSVRRVERHRPYHEIKGWQVHGSQLVGHYDAAHQLVQGYIKHFRSPRPEFFIVNPPPGLKRHPHAVCFHHVGRGHYAVHFTKTPSIDSGILEIEKTLREAFYSRN